MGASYQDASRLDVVSVHGVGGYSIGLMGAVGTIDTMLLVAACVASAAADGALVLLPRSPANGGMRNGILTTADNASPALTFRSWLAASTVWSLATISTM